MKTAGELLELYARSRSEEAFTELVHRYIDLVYSAALRRVNGATQLAEDITQEVFTALAGKADSLPHDVQLGGWLHRHTGFVASTHIRSETRRQHREQEAVAMYSQTADSTAGWHDLAPILDASMDELSDADRDALVLRFFERQDFQRIGATLGVSDDTAQKRVSRALDKLRSILMQRRATVLPAAAMAIALETSSVQAAPANLAAEVARHALANAMGAAKASTTATFAGLALGLWLKIMFGGAAAVIVASLLVLPRLQHRTQPAVEREPQTRSVAGDLKTEQGSNASSSSVASSEKMQASGSQDNLDTNALHLVIVAADSGKPVPNVKVDYRGWQGQKFQGKTFTADRAGVCTVTVPRATITQLELTSRIDGFADTRLKWTPANGQSIPQNYTLRLARAETIGGMVLDENDQPLSGAVVGFNHEDDPVMVKGVETHEFGWIQVNTDATGHWTINRIAPEVLRRIYGSASHNEHIRSPMVFLNRDEKAQQEMLAGKYVFHLGKAVMVRGTVFDSEGQPIAGAKVLAGKRSMSGSRSGKTAADGSFEIKGCTPGKTVLTAEATGYSAATVEVEFKEDSEPFQLVLKRGAVLLVRVVSKTGQPIPRATFYLDTMRQRPINAPDYNTTAVQADFQGKTDAQGLLVWSNAPNDALDFDISADGYMRKHQVKLHADGAEHTVTLNPALIVSGTVHDSDSGEPISAFRLVTGYPQMSFAPDPNKPGQITTNMTPTFPTIDSYWTSYGEGRFRKKIEEPALYDATNPGYVFRFEAEGYAPYISRLIAADEGEVHLDVTLQKVQTGQVTVLRPDGRPAALAEVALLRPGVLASLTPNGFSRSSQGDPSGMLRADDAGHLQFTADPAITQIIAADRSGYATTTAAALLQDPILRLQPWARLEGTWTVGGKPAANRKLWLEFSPAIPGLVFDFTFQSETDEHGHYIFDHVPSAKLKLLYLAYASPNSFSHVQLQNSEVETRAGETSTKDLGGDGYVLTVHLAWPAEIVPGKAWRCSGALFAAPPAEIRDALNDPRKMAALKDSPAAAEYMRASKPIPMQPADFTTLVAEEIPPGDYMIMAHAYQHEDGAGPLRSLMGTSASISVPSTPAAGELDAGTIQLRTMEIAGKQP